MLFDITISASSYKFELNIPQKCRTSRKLYNIQSDFVLFSDIRKDIKNQLSILLRYLVK